MNSRKNTLTDVEFQPFISGNADKLPSTSFNFIFSKLKASSSSKKNDHPPGDEMVTQRQIKSAIVKRAAVASLFESAPIIAYCTTVQFFLAPNTNWMRNPFIPSIFIAFLNFLFRIPTPENKWSQFALRSLRGASFSLIDLNTLNILTHEILGHGLATALFFKNPNPKFTITPSIFIKLPDGMTRYDSTLLSNLGEQLGMINSHIAVTAAGATATTFRSAISLVAAQLIPDRYPEIKSHLRITVLLSVLADAYYASTAYFGCNNSHDYCKLNESGFPPIAAILLIVGMMLLLQLFLSGMSYAMNACSRHEEKSSQFIETERELKFQL